MPELSSGHGRLQDSQAESVPQENMVSMVGNSTQETAAMCRGRPRYFKEKKKQGSQEKPVVEN